MSIVASGSFDNRHSLESLVKIHYHPIFRFVRSRIEDEFEADEITNDCFLNLYFYKGKINNHEAFLFTTAKNKIIDFYRKRIVTIKGIKMRKDEMLSLDDDNNGVAGKLSITHEFYGDEKKTHFDTQRQILNDCTSKIPEWEQQIVELEKEGLSNLEIAQIVGKSEKAIERAKNRINMKLKYQAQKLYKTKVA